MVDRGEINYLEEAHWRRREEIIEYYQLIAIKFGKI